MKKAELEKRTAGQPMFGAGNTQPAIERNFQVLEWTLPSGERFLLETSVFQLDGKNPYAVRGGPTMPLYRMVELKKKGMIGWKKLGSLMEYSGGFALLNAVIRATKTYLSAVQAGQGGTVLIQKQEYEHANFGRHAFYGLAEEGPATALTEALSECGSVDRFMSRLRDLEASADSTLAEEKKRLQEELEEFRQSARR
jgi:hypothetical protein